MSSLAQLSRAERREAERQMVRENNKWPEQLKEWPREDWPKANPTVLRVLRSRGFLVQEYLADAPALLRLSINRTSLAKGGEWAQEITWEELQRLKGEAGYANFDAVEVYPPDSDVVNVANMRHLWILPRGHLTFAWRQRT